MNQRQIALLLLLGLGVSAGSAGLVYVLFGAADRPEIAEEPPAPIAQRAAEEPPPPVVQREDPNPPPAASPPVPGELRLPDDGGVWPWPVAPAAVEAPGVPVSLTRYLDAKGGARVLKAASAAVNPRSGKAIVSFSGFDPKNRPSAEASWGEVWVCDVSTGRVTGQWTTKKILAPFDVHADGRHFLFRGGNRYDLGTQEVELWTTGDGGKPRRRTWKPSTAGSFGGGVLSVSESNSHAPEAQVKWAGFVGDDRVATVHGSTLKLWDLAELKQVAQFAGVVGLPAVSPDGGKLAFLTGDGIALLDSATLQIVAARRLGPPPSSPMLVFHPDAKKLAVIGTGRIAVLMLTTGRVWDAIVPELKNDPAGDWFDMPPPCGWAGDRHIFFKGDLYDPDMPAPVWHYAWADWAGVAGRNVWAVVDHPADRQIVLRPFTLPHPGMQTRLHTLLLTSNIFSLRPGDEVRVDVAGLPAEHRGEIRAVLERRLKALGYKIDPAAAVAFKAAIDGVTKRKTISYTNGSDYTYDERPARVEVVKNGAVIWKAAAAVSPPLLIYYKLGEAPENGHATEFGRPDYGVYTERELPGVIRSSRSQGALGTSYFRVTGIQDR